MNIKIRNVSELYSLINIVRGYFKISVFYILRMDCLMCILHKTLVAANREIGS